MNETAYIQIQNAKDFVSLTVISFKCMESYHRKLINIIIVAMAMIMGMKVTKTFRYE